MEIALCHVINNRIVMFMYTCTRESAVEMIISLTFYLFFTYFLVLPTFSAVIVCLGNIIPGRKAKKFFRLMLRELDCLKNKIIPQGAISSNKLHYVIVE